MPPDSSPLGLETPRRYAHAMPPIAADRIHAARAITLWSLRLLALLITLYGTYRLLQRIAFWLIADAGPTAFNAWMGVGENHGASIGTAAIITGLTLAAASRPLTRWAMPAPTTGCPNCAYDTNADTCQECGHILR